MKELGTMTLQTDRLLLRRFITEDAQAVFDNWASDFEVTRYLVWTAHKDIKVTEEVIASWIDSYQKPDFYNWAIVLKSIGEPIGSIGVVARNEEVNGVTVGYCIGRNWWRQGIMSEALAAVIQFFIEQAGVSRIEAGHDPLNLNSGRVMTKCGMVYEGTLRQAIRNNTGITDYAVYSILSQEYAGKK